MVHYDVAFSKPFSDWRKLGIGVLVSILPVVNWIGLGFYLESSGMGSAKPSKTMPEWKSMGSYFIKGLYAALISVLYMLPSLLFLGIGLSITFAMMFRAVFTDVIPPYIMNSVLIGDAPPSVIVQLLQNNWWLIAPYLLTLAPIIIIAFLLHVAASYMLPAAILNSLKKRSLSAAFDVGKVIKAVCTKEYLLVWIVSMLVTAIAYLLVSWIPVVGHGAAFFASGVFSFTLFGEVLRKI